MASEQRTRFFKLFSKFFPTPLELDFEDGWLDPIGHALSTLNIVIDDIGQGDIQIHVTVLEKQNGNLHCELTTLFPKLDPKLPNHEKAQYAGIFQMVKDIVEGVRLVLVARCGHTCEITGGTGQICCKGPGEEYRVLCPEKVKELKFTPIF